MEQIWGGEQSKKSDISSNDSFDNFDVGVTLDFAGGQLLISLAPEEDVDDLIGIAWTFYPSSTDRKALQLYVCEGSPAEPILPNELDSTQLATGDDIQFTTVSDGGVVTERVDIQRCIIGKDNADYIEVKYLKESSAVSENVRLTLPN